MTDKHRADALFQVIAFSPGDILLRQGAEGTHAFYIEEGRVEVSIQDAHGNKTVLSELGPGHVVGEMALIDGGIRSATVTAKTVVRAKNISAEDFRRQLESTNKVFRAILEILVDRLKRANTLLANSSRADKP